MAFVSFPKTAGLLGMVVVILAVIAIVNNVQPIGNLVRSRT